MVQTVHLRQHGPGTSGPLHHIHQLRLLAPLRSTRVCISDLSSQPRVHPSPIGLSDHEDRPQQPSLLPVKGRRDIIDPQYFAATIQWFLVDLFGTKRGLMAFIYRALTILRLHLESTTLTQVWPSINRHSFTETLDQPPPLGGRCNTYITLLQPRPATPEDYGSITTP